MECPRWTRPQFTTLAEFLKNDSDFQSCMIYGSESSFFGLKMGGVQKMHLMIVSTTFLEKMSYHLEANFSTLAKNYNLKKITIWKPSSSKVIIDKSRGEVSLLEKDTFENVSSPIKNQKK